MAKWIAAEKARAGLRHEVVCPKVTGRTKGRIAQSKRARAGSLAIVDESKVARTYFLQANVVLLSFSGVTFVLFCFVTTACVLFFRFCFFIFFVSWRCRFFRVFLYHYRFLFVRRARRTFFPSGWCTTNYHTLCSYWT